MEGWANNHTDAFLPAMPGLTVGSDADRLSLVNIVCRSTTD